MSPRIEGVERLEEVGQGAFAVVYRGRQEALHRDVAVKVLSGAFDAASLRRFDRECATVGSLSDEPGIVTVYAAGRTPDGSPYLVMPFLTGGTLADRIESGPLPALEVIDCGLDICRALDAAHAAGILHLDVKPANVLVNARGERQLSDFGIARFVEGGAQTASLSGTPSYAGPEIFAGGEPDVRSDVYSLGATLYALAAGHAPFRMDGRGLTQLLIEISNEPPADLRTLGVPAPLWKVIERALSKDPSARQASAGEVIRELLAARSALGGKESSVAEAPAAPLHADEGGTVIETADRLAGTEPATRSAADDGSSTVIETPEVVAAAREDAAGDAGNDADGDADAAEPTRTPTPPPTRSRLRAVVGALVAVVALVVVVVVAGPFRGGGGEAGTAGDDSGDDTGEEDGDATTVPSSSEPSVPVTVVSEPAEAWVLETGSRLSSTAVVAGDAAPGAPRIFFGTQDTRSVLALDEDGTEVWARELGAAVPGSPALASVDAADDVLVAASGDGVLHAIDVTDGTLRWSQPLDVCEPDPCGLEGDVLVPDGQRVDLADGNASPVAFLADNAGAVHARAVRTGAEVWTTFVDGAVNNRLAFLPARGEDPARVVVAGTDGFLRLLDAATGAEAGAVQTGPVWFADPAVYPTGPDGAPEIWVGSAGTGDEGGRLWRIGTTPFEAVTSFPVPSGRPVSTRPLLTEDGSLVVAGSEGGELFAVIVASNGEAWRESVAEDLIKGSPVDHDGIVYVGTHARELLGVDATTGEERWSFAAAGIFGASEPVIDGDRLYVGNDDGSFYAFDLP